MRTRFKRNMIVLRTGLYLLGIGFFGYFSYHALTGIYGLRSGNVMEARIKELTSQSKVLDQRLGYLKKQVMLMSDGTMEADMLDERARNLLAVSRADEIVIYR